MSSNKTILKFQTHLMMKEKHYEWIWSIHWRDKSMWRIAAWKKSIIEIEADSPEAYVKANGRFPIMEISKNSNGDEVIITGDGNGYYIRYIFSE